MNHTKSQGYRRTTVSLGVEVLRKAEGLDGPTRQAVTLRLIEIYIVPNVGRLASRIIPELDA